MDEESASPSDGGTEPPTAIEPPTTPTGTDSQVPPPGTVVPTHSTVSGEAPVLAPPSRTPAVGTGTVKRRNVVAVWLGLPLITLGFYLWHWWPKVNRELAQVDPRIKVNGLGVWAAMYPGAILIVPPFVSVYNTGKRIARAQHAAGVGSSCSPVLGLFLMFVFSLTPFYYQSELNKIADARS